MADWNQPGLPDAYSNFLDALTARDIDAMTLGIGTITNPKAGMMRFERTRGVFQEYNATSGWLDKVLSVAGGGTGANNSGGAGSALGLGSMAYQNANAVNITGGQISSLSSIQVNGNGAINGQLDVAGLVSTAAAQIIGAGGLTVTNDVSFGRQLYGPTINLSGNLSAANITGSGTVSGNALTATNDVTGNRCIANTDVIANQNLGVSGVLYIGNPQRQFTYSDGRIITSVIGFGWSGAGTKVLLDNDQWTDIKTIGGGVREIVHQNMSFGTDEYDKTVVIPWGGAQPPSAKCWHLQFDQPYQDQASSNGGPVFYSVTYSGPNTANIHRTMGPGAVAPILAASVVYTAFHHRTEIS